MVSRTEQAQLTKLSKSPPHREETLNILAIVSPLVGTGSSHGLKSLRIGLLPICALLASERLGIMDNTSIQEAQTASCLSEKDFRRARETVARALIAGENSQANRKSKDVEWPGLIKFFKLGDNISISLKEMEGEERPTTAAARYAIFRWVVLAAEVVRAEEIDGYLSERGQRLESIYQYCAGFDQHYPEKKTSILRSQRVEKGRRRSPSKTYGKSKRLVNNVGTPVINRYMNGLRIHSPTKRAAEDAMDVDASRGLSEGPPSKRMRTERDDHGAMCSPRASLTPPLLQEELEVPGVREEPEPDTGPPSGAFCGMEEEGLEEERRDSPKKWSRREIPVCGLRRELFLDRKPWQTLDSRMHNHIARFPFLLNHLLNPRIIAIKGVS